MEGDMTNTSPVRALITGAEKRQRTTGHDWIVYTVPDMDAVQILQTHYLRNDGKTPRMDVYYPPHYQFNEPLPGMIIFSIRTSSMHKASYVSWAQLLATFRMAVITYEATEERTDYLALRQYVSTATSFLKITSSRIGVVAFCGALNHLSNILPSLPHDGLMNIACGIFFSGIVASPRRYRPMFPVLLVDSGRDYAVCTQSFARFRKYAPDYGITHDILEYPDGVHRFDVVQDTEDSRTIIRQMLAYIHKTL
jgi:hypothetical protein